MLQLITKIKGLGVGGGDVGLFLFVWVEVQDYGSGGGFWGSGLRVSLDMVWGISGLGLKVWVYDSGYRIQGIRLGMWDAWGGGWGAGCGVWGGSGCRFLSFG